MNQRYNKPQPQNQGKIVATKVSTQVSRSGPLPASVEFEHYEKILPGLGNRIMIMAEKDQQSQIERLDKAQSHEIGLRYVGIVFAFLIVMVFCAIIYVSIINDMEIAASVISVASLATLISKFYNHKS